MGYDSWKTYNPDWDVVDTSYCDYCKDDDSLCKTGEHPFFIQLENPSRCFEFCCEACMLGWRDEYFDEETDTTNDEIIDNAISKAVGE